MQRKATTSTEIDVDQIVAQYTALGRTQRRAGTLRRRWIAAGVAAALAAGAATIWFGVNFRAVSFGAPQAGTDDLRAMVSAELAELMAARAELAAERDRFAANSRALEAQLADFSQRHGALATQQAALEEQSTQLRAALADTDAQRVALVAAQTGGTAVERELASIGAERRSLEERSRTFASQGQRLSTELESLERQRGELEAQRAAMESQRKELESLLNAAGAGASVRSDALEATPAGTSTEPSTLLATAVDPTELGEMRGGIMFGNGMNVDIGLTRTASINGEEMYSSSLRLDDLTAGIDPSALQNFGPLVIQSGSGNYLSPTALEGLSSGFGTIVQNSLDNQQISTTTIYDVSIQDVASAVRDAAAAQAVADSLSFHH